MNLRHLFVIAVVALTACKKDPAPTGGGGTGAMGTAGTEPTNTGTGTGTGSTGTAPEGKNPTGCNSDLSQPIVADYAFTAACSPYKVKGDFNVDGYTLTVEAGTTIELADNATFNIGYYNPAKLIVNGTKEKPVKFTGPGWKTLYFDAKGAGSALHHVEISGAGSEDSAALDTNTFDLVLDGVKFSGAKKVVIDAKEVDRPLKTVTGVDASKSTADASEFMHVAVATAGVFTPASITVPEKAVIWLHGHLENEVALSAVATWRAPDEMNIDPQEGKSASLTLNEGVVLELGENTMLSFGYYRGPAGFKVLGTKEKPVTLTRYGEDKAQTPWRGLSFAKGARAPEIDFLVIEYAGGTDSAALSHDDSRGLGKLTNSTFRHLKGAGVKVSSSRERFTAFDGNTFDDVEEAALRVPLELAHGLGKANKFTDKARVRLTGEAKKDTTLEDVGAPYLVEGELNVNGDDTKATTLTIAPGATLLFNDQGKLSVGYYGNGKLVAKGDGGKAITFGKLTGGWGGLGIYGKGAVELENVVIQGTGDDVTPLEVAPEATGSIKKVSLKATKKGVHSCKVKPEGVTADKGVTAVEKCD